MKRGAIYVTDAELARMNDPDLLDEMRRRFEEHYDAAVNSGCGDNRFSIKPRKVQGGLCSKR